MTHPREIFFEAAHALLQHRVRAALSVAGLVFGVASVTASFAIADGARAAAIDEFGALGVTNILIRDHSDNGDPSVLRRDDVMPIAAIAPGVVHTAAIRIGDVVAGTGQTRVNDALLAGVTADWPMITGAAIAGGRWPTAFESAAASRVAVIGAGLARQLFGTDSPIGRRVVAGASWYEVIGVAAPRGTARSAMTLFDLDRAVLVPFGAMDWRQGRGDTVDAARELIVQVGTAGDVDGAAAIATAVLARRHSDASRYRVIVPRELLRARIAASRTANVLLFAVGGMALVISGVGIMNIMLANVIERTPEIGVRRAFGARRPDILAQFAIESVLLCIAGGLIGVPLGVGMATVAAWAGGWPIAISAVSIVLALGLAAVVGVGFGLYPAHRAAAIQPVDALRA